MDINNIIDKGSFGDVIPIDNGKVKKIYRDVNNEFRLSAFIKEIYVLSFMKQQKINNSIKSYSIKKYEITLKRYISSLYEKMFYDNIERKQIISQLLSLIHNLHCHGILHRDIKPKNILIGENDKLFLCDFGSSTPINNVPIPKSTCYTSYMYLQPKF